MVGNNRFLVKFRHEFRRGFDYTSQLVLSWESHDEMEDDYLQNF